MTAWSGAESVSEGSHAIVECPSRPTDEARTVMGGETFLDEDALIANSVSHDGCAWAKVYLSLGRLTDLGLLWRSECMTML